MKQWFKRQWRKKTYLRNFGSKSFRLTLRNLGNKTSLKKAGILKRKTNGYRIISIICQCSVKTEKTWFQTKQIHICSYPCNHLILQKHLERNLSAVRRCYRKPSHLAKDKRRNRFQYVGIPKYSIPFHKLFWPFSDLNSEAHESLKIECKSRNSMGDSVNKAFLRETQGI